MNCDQCKRRYAPAGKRLCITCAARLKAQVLEAELVRARADLVALRAQKITVTDSKPLDQMELADASIRRCRRCDDRYIPKSGHQCRRTRKGVVV